MDFACLSARLCVEVDGEAHERAGRPQHDAARDAFIERRGFLIMRIPAAEVFRNLEGVVLGIVEQCRRRGPLHRPTDGPPPRSGEEQC
jgi:very-short-patch-repair endonuclease